MVESNILLGKKHLKPTEFIILIHMNRKGSLRKVQIERNKAINENYSNSIYKWGVRGSAIHGHVSIMKAMA